MILREFRMAGEIRSYAAPSGKAMRVSGLAARYSSPTFIGDKTNAKRSYKEVLAPGSFRAAMTPAALKEHDPTLRLNHDPNKVLGRLSAGTLRLRATAEGLEFDADLPPTEDGRSVYESVKRGDMAACSFGFSDADADWDIEEGRARRTIRSIRALHDVSIVTEPAYKETFVQARSNGLQAIEYRDGSTVVIPKNILEKVSDADAADVIRRRRELLNAVL